MLNIEYHRLLLNNIMTTSRFVDSHQVIELANSLQLCYYHLSMIAQPLEKEPVSSCRFNLVFAVELDNCLIVRK